MNQSDFYNNGVSLLAKKFEKDYFRLKVVEPGAELENVFENWARAYIRGSDLRRNVWLKVMENFSKHLRG